MEKRKAIRSSANPVALPSLSRQGRRHIRRHLSFPTSRRSSGSLIPLAMVLLFSQVCSATLVSQDESQAAQQERLQRDPVTRSDSLPRPRVEQPDSLAAGLPVATTAKPDTAPVPLQARLIAKLMPVLKDWWPVIPVLILGLAALGAVRLARRRRRRRVTPGRQDNVVRVGRRTLWLSNAQHKGARQMQEDAFAFSDPSNQTMLDAVGVVGVVADGMGGLLQGADASRIAVQRFLRDLEMNSHSAPSVPAALSHAVEAANMAVVGMADSVGVQTGHMGSTFAAVSVSAAGLHWIAVGDTRIYVSRAGHLHQVNVDHTPERELARARTPNGVAYAADTDPHCVTSYLGLPQIPAIDRSYQPYPLRHGDQIIVCSDGLYGTLGETNLAGLLAWGPGVNAELLVHQALSHDREDQDNLTVIAIACD